MAKDEPADNVPLIFNKGFIVMKNTRKPLRLPAFFALQARVVCGAKKSQFLYFQTRPKR